MHTRFEPQRGQDAERKRSGNAFAGVFLERQPCGTAPAVLAGLRSRSKLVVGGAAHLRFVKAKVNFKSSGRYP